MEKWRGGRSPKDGFERGWGIEFGDLGVEIERDPDFRNAIQLAEGRSVVVHERLKNLFLLVTRYLPRLSSGHIVEFGSYRGGSAFFLALLAAKYLPGTVVYALDTFAGMPATDAAVDAHGAGDFRVEFGEIEEARKRFGLENLRLIKGLFTDTAPRLLNEAKRIRLVHIDCDLRDSVGYAYNASRPFMVPCGYIVFDDATTSTCLGATEIVEELAIRRDGLFSEQIWPHYVFRAPAQI